jgi:hypothetical protein
MTKERKVPVSPAEAYPLGHAKENKDASAYTGFKYPSGGGNDIGIYKQPMINPNGTEHESVAMAGNGISKMNMSVGGVSKVVRLAANKANNELRSTVSSDSGLCRNYRTTFCS